MQMIAPTARARAFRLLAMAALTAALAIAPGASRTLSQALAQTLAQTANQNSDQAGATPPAPPCALSGSSSVFAEGRGMLTIGDVAGCPDLRYEVIPNVMINGQPAVRLLPTEGCAPAGANSVRTGDGAAGTTGVGC